MNILFIFLFYIIICPVIVAENVSQDEMLKKMYSIEKQNQQLSKKIEEAREEWLVLSDVILQHQEQLDKHQKQLKDVKTNKTAIYCFVENYGWTIPILIGCSMPFVTGIAITYLKTTQKNSD